MSYIQKLILKDVRCFGDEQEFNIRPLTFLVGENSTGKSTALACFQILFNLIKGKDLDFNVDPYRMGSFADIVRKSNPKKDYFQIAFEFQSEIESFRHVLTLIEKEKGSEPVIQEQKIIFDDGKIIIKEIKYNRSNRQTTFMGIEGISIEQTTDQTRNFVIKMNPPYFDRDIFPPRVISYMLSNFLRREKSKQEKEFAEFLKEKSDYFHLMGNLYWDTNVRSFSPIRSKPHRTYDPLKEIESPEGSDIPMVLMNMYKTDPEKWKSFRDKLVKFGKASGLFTDIAVRKHGRSMSDPFQLQIKVKGPKVNLIDVGYGVSQILPILVGILNNSSETTFLLQQPEVHLHPRGQAELCSLLIADCKPQHRRKHSFVIETHSEYMIDRACIEIRNGNIKPEDVSLIYLEAEGNKVKVHNITFDEQGNLENVPGGYNHFLMKETNRFIGLED